MALIARVLHISDLHFVEKLTKQGRTWYQKPADALKAKPHAFDKVEALAVQVKRIEKQDGRAFNLLLATGDLTTNGAEGAFNTMLEFLQSEEIRRGNPSRPITEGLAADPTRRLLIPGNHDRYTRNWIPMQSRSNRFETVLNTPNQYPYVVGYRRDNRMAVEPTLLFFVFDSTPSAVAGFWPHQKIARGRIEGRECRWLVDQVERLRREGTVERLGGVPMAIDFDRCIRIAVLHHHPFVKKGTTLMENNKMFINACFEAKIDLVLFGHEHKNYYARLRQRNPQPAGAIPHRIHFYCCPSTTEYSAKNGFYLFDLYENYFISELYEWNNGSFVSQAKIRREIYR